MDDTVPSRPGWADRADREPTEIGLDRAMASSRRPEDVIGRVLQAGLGAGARRELLGELTRSQLDYEVRQGRLVAPFPRAYVLPGDLGDVAVLEAAALRSVGGDAALSHDSACRRWGLELPSELGVRRASELLSGEAGNTALIPGRAAAAVIPGGTALTPGGTALIHVTTSTRRRVRGIPGLAVHRTRRPIHPTFRGGLPTLSLEAAIVGCSKLTHGHGGSLAALRAPALLAVRRRLTTPDRLLAELAVSQGPAELRRVVELLAAGCHSELELWGYLEVFDVPGVRGASRQRHVRVGRRSYYLDMAYETEMVAVELDGRAYHERPGQWERDIARDLALATLGWQTIRLPHGRLTREIEQCRRDVLAVLSARRRNAG
jgi:very-short-patch-repair endonuclease